MMKPSQVYVDDYLEKRKLSKSKIKRDETKIDTWAIDSHQTCGKSNTTIVASFTGRHILAKQKNSEAGEPIKEAFLGVVDL